MFKNLNRQWKFRYGVTNFISPKKNIALLLNDIINCEKNLQKDSLPDDLLVCKNSHHCFLWFDEKKNYQCKIIRL
jgi:hypothetical protein